jgi:drug/metabolite transporter (DMT)-like permease
VGLAVCGGAAFSVYLICSKQATSEAVFWPLAAGRATSVVLMLIIGGISLRAASPKERAMGRFALMTAVGVLHAMADALFSYAVRYGRLDVATILSGFYPAATAGFARLILNERVSRRQFIGIGGALGF